MAGKNIARIAVQTGVDRCFDYTVPPELRDSVVPGALVEVPFRTSFMRGYVIALTDQSEFSKLRPVHRVLGEGPLISRELARLATWMADYYCAPLERAMRTVLPGAVRKSGASFREQLWARVCETDASQDEIKTQLTRAPRQLEAYEHLLKLGTEGASVSAVLLETKASRSALQALATRGLVEIVPSRFRRDPLAGKTVLPTKPLTLMPEQASALETIRESVDTLNPPVVLLHGVTGSGKTEVYMQAISHVLEEGKGAIVLVPEISLTPQTVGRFQGRFGERIAVLHSHLSDGERHDEWQRIRKGEAHVVVGARSAVFAPLSNLGLIVVDEEHETSYKQDEAPRYNARDVAVMRGHLAGCSVVLGSATPCLESWANGRNGKYRTVLLTKRVDDRRMPAMRIVDMRLAAEDSGQVGVFSPDLLEAMRGRIERGEQIILFLNRRGYATSLVCHRCGFVAQCENCSVSCTYHRKDELLKCHICGDTRKVPQKCPECSDPSFKYSGVGTQRVETIIRKFFPKIRVERMDADTMTRKDAYDRILGDFRAGKVQVLVGTQMIAKGLHFPNVTLVGVIYADVSLHMPDFRAGERTFQLLAQVSGRAGRGDIPGEVIVQTFTPHHPAIQMARRLAFDEFCDQEYEARLELSYPPITHLVCITLRGKYEEKVIACSNQLARKLRPRLESRVIISDPVAAPIARAKQQYRYQLMLRCASTRAMTAPLRKALAELKFPRDITCTVDVDALSLL